MIVAIAVMRGELRMPRTQSENQKSNGYVSWFVQSEKFVESHSDKLGDISKGIVEETQVILPPTALIEQFADVAGPV